MISETSSTNSPPLADQVFSWGLSRRKQLFLKEFLGGVRVRSVKKGDQVSPGASLILWGSASAPAGLPHDVRLVRVEDGFLRSVGLGADLVRPLSWVIDSRGLYYDATQASDLEHLLQTATFDTGLLQRADALRRRIVECGITKYNLTAGSWKRPETTAAVILVPGQVESDASIRHGAPGVSTNMELLRAVRQAHPTAWVLYKPHPDVCAGLRRKGVGEDEALSWCDEIITDVTMAELLPQVDELHVLTSLTGFEALLRGKPVTCHGQPFYSGWGLTTDLLPVERRTRKLQLDELVAGSLILYPRYVARKDGRLTTPERALDDLLAWREESGGPLSPWQRLKRVCVRQIVGVR